MCVHFESCYNAVVMFIVLDDGSVLIPLLVTPRFKVMDVFADSADRIGEFTFYALP